MIDISDQVLIQRGQQGDREAVGQLYRRYAQAIARYVTYRVPDDAVIEDITAEVFLRMIEGLPQYRITGAPFEAGYIVLRRRGSVIIIANKPAAQNRRCPTNSWIAWHRWN